MIAAFVLAPVASAAAADNARPVKVMTRNLYLGADLNPPIRAALAQLQAGNGAAAAIGAFGTANAQLWSIVQQTNFPARVKLLAREIDDTQPDLIGLQEVALWRSGELQLPDQSGLNGFGTPNAETVEYDFLEILLDELEAVGQHYEIVTVTQEADVEAPSFTNPPRDRRLTMRDVILRRQDVRVVASGTGNYATNFSIPFGTTGVAYTFTRGYGWADVVANKRAFRFVNTHLESEFSGYALAQAVELTTTGPAGATDRDVVLVCDCNSDPLNATIKPGDSVPHYAAYRYITQQAGFYDEWLLARPSDPGFTSGLSQFVNDADLSSIDHRIDMVFGRRADGKKIPASRGWIVGDTYRTQGGLWASDHMGVVVALKP